MSNDRWEIKATYTDGTTRAYGPFHPMFWWYLARVVFGSHSR